MIVLITDFGLTGPYTGQVKAVLAQQAPAVPVIDLFADAPVWNPQATAYLLAAHAPLFPQGTVFLCVVDPGVGSARKPLVLEAGGRRFVGPDNGLFEIVARRSPEPPEAQEIVWRPERLSSSFHGRDLFAPVAAAVAAGQDVRQRLRPMEALRFPDWPDDLAEIVYIDVYGNAMTGVRGSALTRDAEVEIGGRRLRRAATFSDVPPGDAFWYVNSSGLAEIAVNQGRADRTLGLSIAKPVSIVATGA